MVKALSRFMWSPSFAGSARSPRMLCAPGFWSYHARELAFVHSVITQNGQYSG